MQLQGRILRRSTNDADGRLVTALPSTADGIGTERGIDSAFPSAVSRPATRLGAVSPGWLIPTPAADSGLSRRELARGAFCGGPGVG